MALELLKLGIFWLNQTSICYCFTFFVYKYLFKEKQNQFNEDQNDDDVAKLEEGNPKKIKKWMNQKNSLHFISSDLISYGMVNVKGFQVSKSWHIDRDK